AKASLPAMSKGQVLIFSTRHCRYCVQARDYMKRQHIAYREKDIERSAEAKKDFLRYGGRGVPFFLIGTAAGTRKLSGFSAAGFKAVYPR
ncbi:MAG: glutaredoxin family protein, partial [gamma proteobacterium symbiont of Bathyaustriella thionipta]|nr:glutaredoxin family protein [gamma proteobacterium symbiont of Bathyaustriella thionipta]